MAQRLMVLYAKSGMGKSSLINAGLKEMLWEKGVLPLPVRLNDREGGPSKTLYEGVKQAVKDRAGEYTPGTEVTLWHFFKTAEFWRGDLLLMPLLILDQFEELFTLQSPENREPFVKQLGALILGVRPPIASEDGARRLTDAPPEIKVLISLREDYLGHLEELSTAIPQILDNRFRLGPLFEPEARQAIEEPARLDDPRLATKPFTYTPEAMDGIWTFLSQRLPGQVVESQPFVEPFQLQLVCQRAEDIAHSHEARQDGQLATITWDALGKDAGLKATLASFYERQIGALPSEVSKRAVRRLCEYGLISVTGRRLSLEEGEIRRAYKVGKDTLAKLVELRLLRADTRVGSVYYELSHDTLVQPILEARRRREKRNRAVRNTAAVIVAVGLLGPLAVSWLTHQSLRRALARDLGRRDAAGLAVGGWTQVPSPPGREFRIGCVPNDPDCGDDEKTEEPATLSRDFWIMTHEVTAEQFKRFLSDATSTFVGRRLLPRDVGMEPQPKWVADNHPVVNVSWFDAVAFCEFVGGRLPTEAEWEYAARGGHPDWIYPWGKERAPDLANGFGKSKDTKQGDQWEKSAPVGSFLPYGYGLHDMAGNVWEWTSSVYRAYPYQAGDGREDPASRQARVVRGGSWFDNPRSLRVSDRDYLSPGYRSGHIGFRCARDGSP